MTFSGRLYSITFKFSREERDKIMALMGRPGGAYVTSMEVEEWVRFVVTENLKVDAPKSTLRIKKKRK